MVHDHGHESESDHELGRHSPGPKHGHHHDKDEHANSITETDIPEDKKDLPPLISQYGDPSATSWLEWRYSIWRGGSHTKQDPRVLGYIASGRFALAWGSPLCKREHLRSVAEEFVGWCEENKKKPVWACINHELETILAEGVHGVKWKTIQCIREDVLHPDKVDLEKKEIKQNRRRAMRAGVSVKEIHVKGPDFVPDPETKRQIEEGLERWRAHRHGTQIASSALLPWMDGKHRRYFIASTPEHGIVGVCILAPIAHNSYQIKNSISFPEAPKGTSEDLLGEVIEQMQQEERSSLSFGTSAAEELGPSENHVGGWKFKLMEKGYRKIIQRYHLAERGQFRAKFDTEDEPLYVCYPPHGFGWEGVWSLMKSLRTR